MKRLIPIFLVLLILPNVLAVSVDLKENYSPRETLIAKITGNFLETLDSNNIFFYSDRLLVPMDYDVGKFGNDYYLYAILPNKERNYTLVLKDISYFEMGEDKRGDLEFNFTVSGQIADFTINPGFVVTSKDFNLDLESNIDPITLQVKYLDFSTEVEVPAGRTKSILVPLTFSEEDLDFVEVKSSGADISYEIPVNQIARPAAPKSLVFSKTFYNLTVFKGSPNQIVLYLQNAGQEDLKNIEIVSSNEDVVIIPETVSSLKSTNFIEINLSITPKVNTEFTVSANSDDVSADTTININLIEVGPGGLVPDEIRQYSCPEIGAICTDKQYCDGQEVATLETEHCCAGQCKRKFPTTIVITIILIIGIAVIGYYIWKLKQKKPIKSQQKPTIPKSSEVRKSLSRS